MFSRTAMIISSSSAGSTLEMTGNVTMCVVAFSGNPGQSNYVSSKSGMIGFYKSIAHEVASRNININVVSPGFIVSPMTEKLNEDQRNNYLSRIPMMKFGEPMR